MTDEVRRLQRSDYALLLTIGCMFMAQTFPSAFANSLLPSVFRKEGLDLKQFWIFALPSIPYWIRFVWAPLVDRYWWPSIGRRKSWFIPCTAAACIIYASLALLKPVEGTIITLVTILFIKSLVTATQEIAIDAYAVDAVDKRLQSVVGSWIVVAEALGQMAALILLGWTLSRFGWQSTAFLASLLMFLFLLPAFLRPEAPVAPGVEARLAAERKAGSSAFSPLLRFVRRADTRLLVPLLLLAGLFSGGLFPMIGPFLVDLKMSLSQVGTTIGLVIGSATLIAAFVASALVKRIGTKRALWTTLALLPLGFAPSLYLATVRPAVDVSLAVAALLPTTLAISLFYVTWYGMRIAFASKLQAGTDFSTAGAIVRIGQTLAAAAGGPIAAVLGWSGFFVILGVIGAIAIIALAIVHDRLFAMIDARNQSETE